METERNNILPITENINILKKILSEGKHVVLISDMYLSSEQIRSLLIPFDKIFEDIKIYVSNEYNKAKHNGEIYDYVAQKENVNYKNWIHHGDNSFSDIKKAKEKGIIANLLKYEDLMPYEKFNIWPHIDDYKYQVLMGCARATRMLSADKSDAYKFGCSFAGPILYNYVSWLINQAIERDIKTKTSQNLILWP